MTVAIVISNDWELYGDGSGDYDRLQARPLAAMLDTLDGAGGKLTVMAEVGQQWAHRDLGESAVWARDIADAWDEALRTTIRRGHDAQLHLHPQWLGATWCDDRWRLKMDAWAISQLAPEQGEAALHRGKAYLEALLQPVQPSYACVAFRAGAYCIQPSANVVQALMRAGFRGDTSVTKDHVHVGFFDFRDAPSHVLPWPVGTEVTHRAAGPSPLVEFPICAWQTWVSAGMRHLLPPSAYYRLAFSASVPIEEIDWVARNRAAATAAATRRSRAPAPHLPQTAGKWRRRLAKLIAPETIQLDYDFLPARALVAGIGKAVAACDRRALPRPLPVVLSGHTKTMADTDNLARVVAHARREFSDEVVFWTLGEAVTAWT